MRNALRRRFWLETGIAIVTGVLFVITSIRNDWIEIVFRVDPDNNNGTFEWLIVGALLLVTITLFILASYEWRRTRAAIS
jgi:hypothetical protein